MTNDTIGARRGAAPSVRGRRAIRVADAAVAAIAACVALFAAAAHCAAQPGGRDDPGVALRDGRGREAVQAGCALCHSLDYIRSNAPFLARGGWHAEVTRMVHAFGAPIAASQAAAIVDYLARTYGPPEARSSAADESGPSTARRASAR
jgi:hypothetical protein